MVSAGQLAWLVDLVHEAGSVRQEITMEGAVFQPLRWQELSAWLQCTGEQYSQKWLRDIMRLSSSYATQLNASKDFACEVPFDPGKEK